MKFLETNDWLIINDIVLKIHGMKNHTEMRQFFLDAMRSLISFDKATFYLAEMDEQHFLRAPVALGCCEEELVQYHRVGESIDYTQWIYKHAKDMTFRETDLYREETRGGLPFYIEQYTPYNVHYSLQASLIFNQTLVGVVSFYRSKDSADFSDRDVFILDILKPHLAQSLYDIAPAADQLESKASISLDRKVLSSLCDFTEREIQLIELLVRGYSNDEIAELACISVNTVKKHFLNIYKKAGVTSRLQLFYAISELSDRYK